MGGFRTDGKLLERLKEAVEVLYANGHEGLSDDVEEAIARLVLLLEAADGVEAKS